MKPEEVREGDIFFQPRWSAWACHAYAVARTRRDGSLCLVNTYDGDRIDYSAFSSVKSLDACADAEYVGNLSEYRLTRNDAEFRCYDDNDRLGFPTGSYSEVKMLRKTAKPDPQLVCRGVEHAKQTLGYRIKDSTRDLTYLEALSGQTEFPVDLIYVLERCS